MAKKGTKKRGNSRLGKAMKACKGKKGSAFKACVKRKAKK